jgi:hypothetical protein
LAILAIVVALTGAHHRNAPSVNFAPTDRGPVTHAAIGLSDEDPAAFANPYFRLLARRLNIRTARLIVAYDAPGTASVWIERARAAGLSAYVTLGGDDSCNNPVGVQPASGNCPPPSDAAYTAGFESLVKAFPSVVDWGAWSEPSNYLYYPCATPRGALPPPADACTPARLDARRAAAYWRDAEAADAQMSRTDTIVAGETGADCTAPVFNLCTSDGGHTWTGYVPGYVAALDGMRPAVWGTHSYHDLQRRPALPATETNRFTQFLNAKAGGPQVWLTEEGTWLEGPNGALLNGNATAQHAAAHEFLDLPLVPAARAGQIAREYYYLLQTKRDNGFDSALLDVNGVPRPAYCELVGEPPVDCRGMTIDVKRLQALVPGSRAQARR